VSAFIIAEIGVNHNGSIEIAEKLVIAAANAGADAVKFQTFSADELVLQGARQAEYQTRNAPDIDQRTMLKKLEMPSSWFPHLDELCRTHRVEFMSTAFDKKSVDQLIPKYLKRIKIPSGELTNLPFIEYLTRYDLPLILSTGMGTMEEIADAVSAITRVREENNFSRPLKDMLAILHCTSSYPTRIEDVNMKAMQEIAKHFNVPVGYSDHTDGTIAALAAIALGAVVIEKHITLDTSLPGPDHRASLEPDQFGIMVQQIRELELCLGDGIKKPMISELEVRKVARRGVVLLRSKQKGETITEQDVGILRPEGEIAPKYLDEVIGSTAARNIDRGKSLKWADIEK
jgi:N,N'-diacetyllegionaminate synthase